MSLLLLFNQTGQMVTGSVASAQAPQVVAAAGAIVTPGETVLANLPITAIIAARLPIGLTPPTFVPPWQRV